MFFVERSLVAPRRVLLSETLDKKETCFFLHFLFRVFVATDPDEAQPNVFNAQNITL